MTNAVCQRYASASTDTGHTDGSGSFELGHPEKVVQHSLYHAGQIAILKKGTKE